MSLVAAVVRNETPVPRRVRLHSTAGAPVLPPRRRGVPESGWREDGFAGTVPAEGRLPLGFAVGGTPPEPPVSVQDRGRADVDDEGDPTPTELLRDLGSPAPPREAVPGGDAGGEQAACETSEAAPARDPVPTHVAAWLDAVADRIGRGATEPGDRTALCRVAERAAALADDCPTDDAAGAGAGERR